MAESLHFTHEVVVHRLLIDVVDNDSVLALDSIAMQVVNVHGVSLYLGFVVVVFVSLQPNVGELSAARGRVESISAGG